VSEVAMTRQRTLQVVLVLVGLIFVAAIYPIVMGLRHPAPTDDTGDTMMMSLYFTMGVFLLLAVRDPSRYRSLIAFVAWSNFAHAIVMTWLGFYIHEEKNGFIIASAILVVIGVLFLALLPPRRSE
jgi:phosphotransferase system  glucose/maltose/N-acetylglucosamine-specific IIC component